MTHPVADAVVVWLVTMVNIVSCHVVRTASIDATKILVCVRAALLANVETSVIWIVH